MNLPLFKTRWERSVTRPNAFPALGRLGAAAPARVAESQRQGFGGAPPPSAMPRFGDLLRPLADAQPAGEVTVSGPDTSGTVTWTFKNPALRVGSWVLQRGATKNGTPFEDYVFGQSFNAVYLFNPAQFGTALLRSIPESLPERGTDNNTAPMGVVASPAGRSICFIFTLGPGQTWSMREGGFSNGLRPVSPVLVPVNVSSPFPQTFCYAWRPEQCQGYNQQAGSALPCPPNPWTIQSLLFSTAKQIPVLVADRITEGACP